MATDYILGFDIGGTKSTVLLGDKYGSIIDRISAATEVDQGPLCTLSRMTRDSKILLSRNDVPLEQVSGLGIACGGPLDRIQGVVLSPPNLPGWDNVPVVDIVQQELCLSVVLENDADASALAELLFGAGMSKKNVISITWGTGIGAGLVLDGSLYSGTRSLAGEVGHITYKENGRSCECGKRGCIEAYASGSSITRIVKEQLIAGRQSLLSDNTVISGETICDAAREGDNLCLEVLQEAAQAMGRAVAVLAQILNPEVITLGTLAIKASDLVMPALHQVVQQEVWPSTLNDLTVMPSPLEDRLQDLSALAAYLGRVEASTE